MQDSVTISLVFNAKPQLNRVETYPVQTQPSVEVSERYLPKPAIEEFDGDPLDYWAFVNRFKVHIADRIHSVDNEFA